MILSAATAPERSDRGNEKNMELAAPTGPVELAVHAEVVELTEK